MKDEIKELKKEALEKLGEQENPEPWFSPEEVLQLIAEIESLDEKIGENYWVRMADEKQIEELNKEIKALKAEMDDIGKDATIYYLQSQLDVLREAAEEFITKNPDRVKTNSILRKLQQALVGRGGEKMKAKQLAKQIIEKIQKFRTHDFENSAQELRQAHFTLKAIEQLCSALFNLQINDSMIDDSKTESGG